MAMAQNNDSWPNGLKRILGDIAQLSTLQDADINFANQLQGAIVNHLRQGLPSAFGQYVNVDQVGPPPLTGPQGPQGPPPGTMTGGGSPGLNPGMPAVSELARILGNNGAVQ